MNGYANSKLSLGEWDASCCAITPFCCQLLFSVLIRINGPLLWSSGQEFLAADPEVLVRFPALPDFLRSSGSGTGFTQPREYN
jgi:hypothetical protein